MTQKISPGPEDPWEPNEANYRAYTRMRILAGVLLVPLLVLIANVFFEFMFAGYEEYALVIMMIVLFVFWTRFPTPMQMHRLNEWKGDGARNSISESDLEYNMGLLDRLVVPAALLIVAIVVLMMVFDVEVLYFEFISAGFVAGVFLIIARYAAAIRRVLDKSDRS